jgi:hypothetical protein
MMTKLRLDDLAPELATELETLFRQHNEPALADQARALEIVERCRCRDRFCATFYPVPRPAIPWGPDHSTYVLLLGALHVDVLDGKIMCVEVLDRNEFREKLHAAMP